MKKKTVKQLAKSQKKLKRAVKDLGKAGKRAEGPAWVAALSAIAGAVATALADQEKRTKVKDVVVDAKDKAVELVETEPTEVHLDESIRSADTREHV